MAAAPAIELSRVSGGYALGQRVVADVSLSIDRGEFVAIIGPNGSGKTTLLRLMAGGLRPAEGQVFFFGRPLPAWPRRQLARHIAVVPQLSIPLFDFTVRDFVALGRTPYLSPWASLGRDDLAAIDEALAAADLTGLADRPITELSGGEFQRTVLARALAQQPEVLLLDEPTAFLDPGHALSIISLLRRLNAGGITVVAVFHDLSMTAAAHRIIALRHGRLFADAPSGDILTEQTLTALYSTPATVLRGPRGEIAVAFREGPGRD